MTEGASHRNDKGGNDGGGRLVFLASIRSDRNRIIVLSDLAAFHWNAVLPARPLSEVEPFAPLRAEGPNGSVL